MRTIQVTVKPNSKTITCQPLLEADGYLVRVKSPPLKGRANQEVIRVLSKYFNLPKSSIVIIKGAASKHKVIGIID